MFDLFAAEAGPAIHVAPGGVVHLGGLTLSNSIVYGWISSLIIIVLLVSVARMVTIRPRGGLIQFIEFGVEFIVKLVDGVFHDRQKAERYVPFFVTVFFFVLLSNWLGLIPGVGESLRSGETPLLRGFTADLNATLAIGICTMAFVYASSIRELGGPLKYLRHFFIGSPLNPLYLVIGLLEMLTDLTRTFSLSLRLFLNVTIGEIVIAVFTYLGGLIGSAAGSSIAALPFTMVELFVGALQAYIFVTLSLMYLSIAASHADDAHAPVSSDLTQEAPTETMKASPGTA